MITKLIFGFMACMLLLAVVLSVLERCGIDTKPNRSIMKCHNVQIIKINETTMKAIDT
jgi:hypothetical protein